MTKMSPTKQELLQPVKTTNPLVYFDISIGEESGKREQLIICVLDLVNCYRMYIFVTDLRSGTHGN